ncbi:MAG: major capsid protein [Acidobacteriia bacterium]|nr:major capsid protein [Terriglobia bacterium]
MPPVIAPLTGHLDMALTQFAKRFSQNGLISDLLAPRVPVGRQTDKYWIFGREDQELTEQQLRATGAPAQRIRRSLSTDSYFCRSHALAADIADEDRAGYTDAGDLEQDSTQALMAKILLQKEDELAAMLTDTAQVTNNTTLAGVSQWSDYGNSKPGTDVETAKSFIRKSGVRPNVMVVGDDVYTQLIAHPALADRFKYVQRGSLNEQDLAAYFGVDQFLVARAVKVTAGTPGFVWGKHALLAYVSPSTSREDISAVKSFIWDSAPGTVGGIGVVTGRNPEPTAKADIVGVDFYYQQKITAVETIYLIKNAVA